MNSNGFQQYKHKYIIQNIRTVKQTDTKVVIIWLFLLSRLEYSYHSVLCFANLPFSPLIFLPFSLPQVIFSMVLQLVKTKFILAFKWWEKRRLFFGMEIRTGVRRSQNKCPGPRAPLQHCGSCSRECRANSCDPVRGMGWGKGREEGAFKRNMIEFSSLCPHSFFLSCHHPCIFIFLLTAL